MNSFFTDNGHPLGGYVKLNYYSSCNFQNVWQSINQYIHPSYDFKAVTQSDFDDIQSSNKKKPSGQKARAQVVVACLHYELNLVNFQDQAGSGYWVSPMTPDTLKSLCIYKSFSKDGKSIVYDAKRGDGISQSAQRKADGRNLFIKAPSAKYNDVYLQYMQ